MSNVQVTYVEKSSKPLGPVRSDTTGGDKTEPYDKHSFLKISQGEAVQFRSQYILGPEGIEAMRKHFHHIADKTTRDGSSKLDLCQGYKPHHHPVGALSRSIMHHYIYNKYESRHRGTMLDIGGSLIRLKTMRDNDGKPFVKRVTSLCPVLDIRDRMRKIAHARSELSDCVFCECAAAYGRERCATCSSDFNVITSIDSCYYPGVLDEMFERCAKDKEQKTIGYVAFNDYDSALRNTGVHGGACDGESMYSIIDNIVRSNVKGNVSMYEHGFINTSDSRSWQYKLKYKDEEIVAVFEELEVIMNGAIPYRLCRVFAWLADTLGDESGGAKNIPVFTDLFKKPFVPEPVVELDDSNDGVEDTMRLMASGGPIPQTNAMCEPTVLPKYIPGLTPVLTPPKSPLSTASQSSALSDDFFKIKEYHGRTVDFQNVTGLDLTNRKEQYYKQITVWNNLLDKFKKWQDDEEDHNALITQFVQDGTTYVQLSLKNKPSMFDWLMCRSGVRKGNTYAAPLKLVMHYLLVVGVKTDATSLMYANLSDMKTRMRESSLEVMDTENGSEALIIASEFLAQQKRRLLKYQSSSDNYKSVAALKKTK